MQSKAPWITNTMLLLISDNDWHPYFHYCEGPRVPKNPYSPIGELRCFAFSITHNSVSQLMLSLPATTWKGSITIRGFEEYQLPIFIFLSASQIPSWLLVENELIWCIPSQEPFDLNNLVNPPLQTGSGLVSLEGPVSVESIRYAFSNSYSTHSSND